MRCKDKLIKIMRCNKKEYYSKLLEENKSNIQGTWKVLNNIIKKVLGKQISFFVNNQNVTINNRKEVVDEFNDYFVKVVKDVK